MTVTGPYENYVRFIGLSTDTKPTDSSIKVGYEFYETDTTLWYIYTGSAWTLRTTTSGNASFTTSTDPAIDAAVSTAIVDAYSGVVITTTAAGNAQTIEDPTITTAGKTFIVANNDTSSDSITVNSVVLEPGEAQAFLWDLSAWLTLEAVSASQISFTPAGSIAATDVQAAVEEVDSEKIAKATFTANSEVLVGTGAGAFAAETGATLRTSIDVDQAGTDNSTDVTLVASATTGGMGITGQAISNRAATALQTGYATDTHITAIEANSLKATNVPTALSMGTIGVAAIAITSDGGTDDVTLPAATNAAAGVATAAQITSLEGKVAKAGDEMSGTLDVILDGGADINIQATKYDDTYSPTILGVRARGSVASPTAVLNSHGLITLGAKGYDGSAMSGIKARIAITTTENWSDTNQGCQMSFATTPNGSTTRTDRMTVGQDGVVNVVGEFTAGTKTFFIAHPVDTEKTLTHAVVEGPEHGLLYRGKTKLKKGRATITLDYFFGMTKGTFAALAQDVTVQSLQNQDGFARVRPGKITPDSFEIICENKGSEDEIAWMIMASRKDDFVKTSSQNGSDGRLILENDKCLTK